MKSLAENVSLVGGEEDNVILNFKYKGISYWIFIIEKILGA